MRKSFQEDTVDGLVKNQWYYKTITGKYSRITEPPALKGLLKVIHSAKVIIHMGNSTVTYGTKFEFFQLCAHALTTSHQIKFGYIAQSPR